MIGFEWASFVTSLALFLLLTMACIVQWSTMKPYSRLFGMAFGAYILISLFVTTGNLAHWDPDVLEWRAPALVMANVWLLVATYALHREWRHEHPNRYPGQHD